MPSSATMQRTAVNTSRVDNPCLFLENQRFVLGHHSASGGVPHGLVREQERAVGLEPQRVAVGL